MLRVLACVLAATPVVAVAQTASPQTAPSPWSLHDALDAPAEVKISATLRFRWDSIAGQPRSGFEPNSNTLNVRTTIFAEYRTGPVRIGGEIYDSRTYLSEPRTPISTGEVNAFEPVQAYVALDLAEPFGRGSKATLQAGRFVLNLGTRRLVAADDFRNTTNGYTGLRADVALPSGARATAVYVLPQQRQPEDRASIAVNDFALDRESFDQVLWGGLITKPRAIGSVGVELTFYHFGERDRSIRPTRDRSLNTAGLRLFREPAPAKVDFEIEPFHQWGSISASALPGSERLPVSATFVHASIGYTFASAWKPRVSLRFDRASGDGTGTTWSRFDTLFGMRRAELAPSGLYNSVGRANVVTPGVRLEFAPSKRDELFVAYRALWLASRFDTFSTTNLRDPTGRAGSFAGHQIEARWRNWIVTDALRLEINLLYLAKGRFLRNAPNAPADGDTRYGSLNLTAFF